MADRSIVYRLIAETSQFRAQMAAAGTSVDQTAARMDGAAKGTNKLAGGLDAMGVSAGAVGAAIGTKVVMSAANFEQAMSSVQAATHESAANMAVLEKAALDAGQSTSFSATEAAAGIENLAKAGVSTKEILAGGLTGALDLAAAGQVDVAFAAEAAATAMTQFNLAGKDVPHIADLLAAGAGKAQGEVADLAAALNQSGLVAGQMGLSIEETTGTLAAFAASGLLGSDAGTSFKTMLLRLANPSKQAADQMAALGISAYDANGELVTMSNLAGQLQGALKDKSQAERDAALATIFGSDAIRAANVLYAEGQSGISGWTDAVDDAGYAAETAATKMDNLKGRWEEFTGALETTMIGQGDDYLGPFGVVLDGATSLLNVFNDLQDATDGWLGTFLGGAVSTGARMFSDIKGLITGDTEATEENAEAKESAADSTNVLTGATSALSTGMQNSLASVEAQQKALEKSRKAASETATSFFNLGDSVDDSKVSLGDWITDLEESAQALANFQKNAERAANRGLRGGLIAALQEAGPAGAMRMRQLANATDEEIARANKAWRRGENQVESYTDTVGGVPESATTLLEVKGAQAATAAVGAVIGQLNAVDGRRAVAEIVTNRVTNFVNRVLPGSPLSRATGGPIYGPGTATSDSIPALLSNGEHVWTAREVANAGGHAAMEAMRQQFRYATGGAVQRFASGGKVGSVDERLAVAQAEQSIRQLLRSLREDGKDRLKGKGREIAKLELEAARAALKAAQAEVGATARGKAREALEARMNTHLEGLNDRLDVNSDRLSELTARQGDLRSAMESLGQATTSRFQTGLFDTERPSDPWAAGARVSGGWFENLATDFAGLEERGNLQAGLIGAGLSGAALEAALKEGTNADLTELLASGKVGEFQSMFNQREMLTALVADQAAQAVYGVEASLVAAEVRVLQEQGDAALALQHKLSAQVEALTRVSAEAPAATGAAVVGGVDSHAARGQSGRNNGTGRQGRGKGPNNRRRV